MDRPAGAVSESRARPDANLQHKARDRDGRHSVDDRLPPVSGDLSVEAQERYQFIQRLLTADLPPPARVLELGAAPGDQIAQLATLGYEATAVDLGLASDDWADGTTGRMSRLLEDAGVDLVTWDLERVPYPLQDGAFDAVVMTEVYEHLREYPVRSLEEVRRVLRLGGRLYFTTPNAAYFMNRARLLMGKSVATPLRDWVGGLPHARHAREYTFAEVEELMRHVGLSVRFSAGRHFYRDSGRVGALMRVAKGVADLISRARPTLGPCIVVVAEKTAG